MLTHLPEPKAQAMINKEEKMNIKQNETNLKTKELIHVVKNEQRTEKQKIRTEATQHRAHAHQIPMALPQDFAHGKAWEVTHGTYTVYVGSSSQDIHLTAQLVV